MRNVIITTDCVIIMTFTIHQKILYLRQVMSPVFCFCHYSCWNIEPSLVWHNLFPSNDLADSTKLHIYLKGGGGCHSFEDGSEKNCVRRWFFNNGSNSISFSPLNIGRAFEENHPICRCGENIDGALCTASTAETFLLDTDTMWSTDPTQNPAFHDFARVENRLFLKS